MLLIADPIIGTSLMIHILLYFSYVTTINHKSLILSILQVCMYFLKYRNMHAWRIFQNQVKIIDFMLLNEHIIWYFTLVNRTFSWVIIILITKCDYLSKNMPSLCNYKYLKMPIWNIQFEYILRRQGCAYMPFSTNS